MFSRKRRTRAPRSARLWLEALESREVPAGTWTQLTNLFPDSNGTGTMVLLPNGQVMINAVGTNVQPPATALLGNNAWYTLTPDQMGSYINGTFAQTAPANLARLFYSSNVLPNGNLFVLGGVYTGTNDLLSYTTTGEIYSPAANTWTNISPIPIPPVPFGLFGDGPSAVLPDGRILVGDAFTDNTYIYNPANDTWVQGPTKLFDDQSQNETWIKLSNGNILSYDTWGYYDHNLLGDPRAVAYEAQQYIPSPIPGGIGQWVDAGNVGFPLEGPNNILGETEVAGPGLALNNGGAFLIGCDAQSFTAIYTPGATPNVAGTWARGPILPTVPNTGTPADSSGANDAPAVELPDGHVLFALADVYNNVFDEYSFFAYPPPPLALEPTLLYDYNPATEQITPVQTPGALTNVLNNNPALLDHMLVLPTGQVLLGDSFQQMWIYTPSDSPITSLEPAVSAIDGSGNTFTLTGTQFNGPSEGASYNSLSESSENYPIVSLTDTHGDVYYVPTFNWSSESVLTGNITETTQFTVPSTPGPGAYLLSVSVDGLTSPPVMFIDMGTGVDDVTVRLNPSNNHNTQILEDDNVLLAEYPQSSFGDIYALTNSPTDTLIIDTTSGDPVSPGYVLYYQGIIGTDTLVGPNQSNLWDIQGQNGGTLNGDVIYTNIPYITGGSGDDHFNILPGSDVTGEINGGNGFDTLDISNSDSTQTYPNPANLFPGTIHGLMDTKNPYSYVSAFDNIDYVETAGNHLLVTTQPANTVVGAPFTVKVEVLDANNVVNPTYNAPLTIALTNNPSGATLGGTLTINAVNGVGTFSGLFLNKTGVNYAMAISSPILQTVPTNNFTITPNTPTHLVVTSQPPTSITAGQFFGLTVKAEDDNGFVALTYNGSVTVQIGNNPGGSTLSGGATVTVPINGGVGIFKGDLALYKTGTAYTLSLTSTSPMTLVSTTTTGINVVAASAVGLVINPEPPTSIAAGDHFGFGVAAEDPYGNVDLTFTQPVTVSLTPSSYNGSLSGPATLHAVNGVVNFSNLVLNRVGSTTLNVTTTNLPTATTTSANIVVVPGAATQLQFTSTPPASVAAGSNLSGSPTGSIVILVQDVEGNTATQFNGPVTVSLADNATGDILKQILTLNAMNGVATFSTLVLTQAGTNYALIGTSPGLSPTESNAFNITALQATQLAVTSEPLNTVTAGTRLGLISDDVQTVTLGGSSTGSFTLTFNGATTPSQVVGTTTAATLQAALANLTTIGSGNVQVTQATGTNIFSVTFIGMLADQDQSQMSTTFANGATSRVATVTNGGVGGVVVSAEDQYGNLDPTFAGSVSIAFASFGNPGNATLFGTLMQTASNGVATFPDLKVTTAGMGYDLAVTSGSLQSTTTTPFNITAGAATQLIVTSQPGNAQVFNAVTFSIAGEDQYGNIDPTFKGTASAAIPLANNPGGASLGGTTSVNISNGTATFSDVTLSKPGTGYKLEATSAGLSVTTNSFNISPSSTVQLAITTQPPSTVTAGSTFTVVVSAEDANGNVTNFNGNVTIALSANPGSSQLGGTLTVQAVNGIATFSNLSLNVAANGYKLQASSGTETAATKAINVTAAAATQLAVTTQPPSSVSAGAGFGFVVKAEDPNGNVDTTFTGPVSVSFADNPGNSVLTGTVTVNAVKGVATFSGLTLNKADSGYALQVHSGTLSQASTNSFAVSASSVSQLVVTAEPPSSTVAGAGFGLTISAEDSFGNVTNFTGNVSVSLLDNPAGGTLGGNLTVLATGGVASFSGLSLNKVGLGYVLQASSGALPSAISTPFSVTPAAATQLVITSEPPGSLSAGTGFGITVKAEDPFGNVDTSFDNLVGVSLLTNPGTGTLGGTNSVTASNGVATFAGLTLDQAGSGYVLQLTSATVTGASTSTINVKPGNATQLIVTTQPGNVAAGQAITVSVAAEDPYGNINTSYNTIVSAQLISNPGGAVLSGTLTATPSNGTATFSALSLNRPGDGYALQLTSGNLTATTTALFNVSPAAASHLVVTAEPPSNVTDGTGFGFTVEAVDPFGNLDTNYDFPVAAVISTNPGGGALTGSNGTSVTASGGIATFSGLSINLVGDGYVLTVSSAGLMSDTTSAVNVTAAPATQLVVATQPPASVGAGMPFGLSVQAEDANGNVDPDYAGLVSLSLSTNPSGALLSGVDSVQASGGIATFSAVTIDKAGSGYVLDATAPGLASPAAAETNAFTVANATTTQLVLTSAAPSNVSAGGKFGFMVAAEDANGNVDTTFSGSVTVGFSVNPGGSTLSGKTTVSAVNGVATFSGLSLNKAGSGYVLAVSSGTLSATTTGSISVAAGSATQLVVTGQPPANVLLGGGFNLTVSGEDNFGNVDPTFTGPVSLAVLGGTSGTALGIPAGQPTVSNGVVTFTGLTINQLGTGYMLEATSGNLAAATSNGFNEVQGVPATTASLSGPSNVSGYYQGAVAVTLTASDPIFTVTATYYQVDNGAYNQYAGPFVVSGDGAHAIHYFSMNSAGKQEATETTTLMIDATPPVTTASVAGKKTAGFYTAAPTITLSAFDATSGVAGTYYSIDGATPVLYSGPFAVSGDAYHAIGYYSVDKAGNQEQFNVLTVAVDTTPPVTTATLTGNQGPNGDYNTAVKITLSASDNVSGVAKTYYKVNNGPLTVYHPGATITVSSQGKSTVSYYSVDLAGHTESTEKTTFTIDTVPPALTVKATAVKSSNAMNVPLSGTTSIGATVSVLITDSIGQTLVYNATVNSNGSWTGNFNAVAANLVNGALTITVTATDAAGNQKVVTVKTTKKT